MTGGMGVVAPAPLLDESELSAVINSIVTPTLSGLRGEGVPYRGVLFFGLMLTPEGVKVLEYNVRFGDPETQAVLPLLENDLLDVLEATVEGRLHEVTLRWKPQHTACVVMAAPGYPGTYERGTPLKIPDFGDDVTVFHAGTERRDGRLVSSGWARAGGDGGRGGVAGGGGRGLRRCLSHRVSKRTLPARHRGAGRLDWGYVRRLQRPTHRRRGRFLYTFERVTWFL